MSHSGNWKHETGREGGLLCRFERLSTDASKRDVLNAVDHRFAHFRGTAQRTCSANHRLDEAASRMQSVSRQNGSWWSHVFSFVRYPLENLNDFVSEATSVTINWLDVFDH